MEPEIAIDASREAIKVCFMVGGPILAVCLVVGLLMGLAQAMSHIQDQALATVPKILTIFAVVAFALPWFADRMIDFSQHQFSTPFMAEPSAATWPIPARENEVRSLIAVPDKIENQSYYPTLDVPKLGRGPSGSVFRQASHIKTFSMPKKVTPETGDSEATPNPDGDRNRFRASPNPFSLPSYRFSRRKSENTEG